MASLVTILIFSYVFQINSLHFQNLSLRLLGHWWRCIDFGEAGQYKGEEIGAKGPDKGRREISAVSKIYVNEITVISQTAKWRQTCVKTAVCLSSLINVLILFCFHSALNHTIATCGSNERLIFRSLSVCQKIRIKCDNTACLVSQFLTEVIFYIKSVQSTCLLT